LFFFYKKNFYVPKIKEENEIEYFKISNHLIRKDINAIYLGLNYIGIIKKIFLKFKKIFLQVSIKKIKFDKLNIIYKIKKNTEIKTILIDFSIIKIIFYIQDNFVCNQFYCNK
jgi:hypothetical protein